MDDKHLEILVRIDERQASMQDKLSELAPIVKQNKQDIAEAKTSLKVMKWVGATGGALATFFGLGGHN